MVVVIFGLWLFPDTTKFDWARDSKSLPYLQNFGDELIAALPPNLEDQVTNILKHNNGAAPSLPTASDENASPDSTQPDNGDNTDTSPNDSSPAPDAAAPAAPSTPAAPGKAANSGV